MLSKRQQLLPLTYTKPVAELRVGILKIVEKWNHHLKTGCSFLTETYLQEKFPAIIEKQNLLINGALLPDEDIAEQIALLKNREALTKNDELLAINIAEEDLEAFFKGELDEYSNSEYDADIHIINNTWDIFTINGEEIELDYEILTEGRSSAEISSSVQTLGKHIFVEEGARVECCIHQCFRWPCLHWERF